MDLMALLQHPPPPVPEVLVRLTMAGCLPPLELVEMVLLVVLVQQMELLAVQ
jgi:hypothetical protein